MNETIKIINYKIGDEEELSNLIKRVYDEFVAPDYSEEGNKFFTNFIVAKNFILRYKQKNNIILIAEVNNCKVGMIEIRDNNHISLLFVEKEHHGEGIAKQLYYEALIKCKKKDKNLNKFYVHASPFSIPIYEKLGFNKTDEMQEQFGLIYLPMEMEV